MANTEANKQAKKNYIKAKTKMVAVRFTYSTDADIIAFLDEHPNKISVFREAVRLLMEKEKQK